MTSNSQPTPTLSVDSFSLVFDSPDLEAVVRFEQDLDLYQGCKGAFQGGERSGLVLVELGIDGADFRRVRVDTMMPSEVDDNTVTYSRDYVLALHDAIEALTAIRDHLEAMHNARPGERQRYEKNAFELGYDAGRAGYVKASEAETAGATS